MSSGNQVAIVTDSTADLPAELCAAWDIHVIAQIIVMDGQSLEDGTGLSRYEFYQRLPEMQQLPTTAAASAGVFEDEYESLLSSGANQVVSVHLADKLSGTINSASIAAQEFPGRVHVFDSGSISMGLGFQALAMARAARQGDSLADILGVAQDARRRVRLIAMLDTLEYVRRSGRVSWSRARIGEILRIKPFLEVSEGLVLSLGQVRTRHLGINRLKELLLGLGQLQALAILHTNAEADALAFLQDLRNQPEYRLPVDPLIVNVTTVIGTHVGPNGLGFASLCA